LVSGREERFVFMMELCVDQKWPQVCKTRPEKKRKQALEGGWWGHQTHFGPNGGGIWAQKRPIIARLSKKMKGPRKHGKKGPFLESGGNGC